MLCAGRVQVRIRPGRPARAQSALNPQGIEDNGDWRAGRRSAEALAPWRGWTPHSRRLQGPLRRVTIPDASFQMKLYTCGHSAMGRPARPGRIYVVVRLTVWNARTTETIYIDGARLIESPTRRARDGWQSSTVAIGLPTEYDSISARVSKADNVIFCHVCLLVVLALGSGCAGRRRRR
jgi:hypothetical protein